MWNDNISWFLNPSSRHIQQKRKGESMVDSMPPLKMHINEEKMVSQLNRIHLSSSYKSHGSNVGESNSSFLDYVLDNTSKNRNSSPSLTISEELKSQLSGSFKFNSTIPDTIKDRLMQLRENNSKALVLWEPRVDTISRTLSIRNSKSEDGDAENSESDVRPSPPAPPNQLIVDVEMMEDSVDDDNNNSVRGNVAQPANPDP